MDLRKLLAGHHAKLTRNILDCLSRTNTLPSQEVDLTRQ